MTKLRVYCQNNRCKNHWNKETFEIETQTKEPIYEGDWLNVAKGEEFSCPLCQEKHTSSIWCYQNCDKKPNEKKQQLLKDAKIVITFEKCDDLSWMTQSIRTPYLVKCVKTLSDDSEKVYEFVLNVEDDCSRILTVERFLTRLYLDCIEGSHIYGYQGWFQRNHVEKKSFEYREFMEAKTEERKKKFLKELYIQYWYERALYADMQELFPGDLYNRLFTDIFIHE